MEFYTILNFILFLILIFALADLDSFPRTIKFLPSRETVVYMQRPLGIIFYSTQRKLLKSPTRATLNGLQRSTAWRQILRGNTMPLAVTIFLFNFTIHSIIKW